MEAAYWRHIALNSLQQTPWKRDCKRICCLVTGLTWLKPDRFKPAGKNRLKPLNFDHQKRLKLAKIKKAPLFYGKTHFKGFILEMLLNDSLMMTKAVIIGWKTNIFAKLSSLPKRSKGLPLCFSEDLLWLFFAL